MNKKNYWWIHYSYPSGGVGPDYQDDLVIDEHPFIWYNKKLNEIWWKKHQLMGWKKITKKEYDLYIKLKNKKENKNHCKS